VARLVNLKAAPVWERQIYCKVTSHLNIK